MTRPFLIVLCEENPYDLINVLGPILAILQPSNFCKIDFSLISSSGKKVRKITKMLQSLKAFNWNLNHSYP